MHRWTEEEIKFLKESYPHFGTFYVERKFHLSWRQVRTKADKLHLHLLPKNERLCRKCKTNYQGKRVWGWYCRLCFNERVKWLRRNRDKSMKTRFQEMLRSARKRSSVKCDLTVEHLTELWYNQKGLCYYSGLEMKFVQWGKGRIPYSVSLDQIIPKKGYTKNNVVLCCWIVNMGKFELLYEEYLKVCLAVVNHQKDVSL